MPDRCRPRRRPLETRPIATLLSPSPPPLAPARPDATRAPGRRIAIATDAWHPQVNGVVRTLSQTVEELRARGHRVLTLTPEGQRTIPCPTYPEIRLALGCGRSIAQSLDDFDPEAVHIATEGPVGWAARRWCRARGRRFTTSLHTRFPDYVALRTGLPAGLFWPVLRAFHGGAARTFVATQSLSDECAARGLGNTHRWSRGVDLSLFGPAAGPHPALAGLPGPVQLTVGRVAVEKNIEAFLATDLPGTKVVVGDGPARAALEQRHPEVRFLGKLAGAELAAAYASADLFIFPSRTDTFGLVIIEALASGVPVAGYPVPGPLDILGADGRGQGGQPLGALDEDLARAMRDALASADPAACQREAHRLYSWARCTDQFLDGLEWRQRAEAAAV